MPYSGVATAGDIVALPEAILDVYSLDIQYTAQGIMRYEEFAVYKTELGTLPGMTVKFTYYSDLTRGAQLAENTALVPQSMAANQKAITVAEYGNAVGVSELLLRTSWEDQLSQAAVLLGRDFAVVRDLDLRDVVVGGGSTIYADPLAAVLADVGAAEVMDVESIRRATELLETANAPKFLGDFYVCFIHPHQGSSIRRDPDWIAAQNYANTRALFNGEMGRWEDVVFIRTTHQGNGAAAAAAPGYEAALDGAGTAGIDLYRATVIADQAFGLADALPVEMRDNGVEDFGRKHALAWYGIWGAGVLEDDNIVHIITA